LPLLTDAVEKVSGTTAPRNNRIIKDNFLNRSCLFGFYFELILLSKIDLLMPASGRRCRAVLCCAVLHNAAARQLPPKREWATVIAPDDVEQVRVRVTSVL
jgi:hypothetical protein